MSNNFAIIMAGGIGSRFWPMSQETHPKQFLDVLGIGKTLIQMTYERLTKIVPDNQIYVVTNEMYADLVKSQIPLSDAQILTEPMRKNTAACIAYASHKIYDINPDANLIVAPSDHLILQEERFYEIVKVALEKANSGDSLVTLGIKPSRPDTGYGYIQFEDGGDILMGEVRKVKQFTEKPNRELAELFVKSGDYYWNSGIFIWKAKTIIESLNKFKPSLNQLFATKGNDYNTPQEQTFINKAFTDCEDISIDFAVLENAKNVHVVLANFGWSDLGTWGSLDTHLDHDVEGNAVIGDKVHMFESENCIVNLPNGKMAVLQGLTDYIIVEAHDILMVVKKDHEQRIKSYLGEVKKKDPDYFKKK
ncbi:mannose-1-phosphate guanylyltransferase [Crocinitomix catalasitica]|uniref:mannose-1-phosphate guanylyltransferase n=1 Tax=Crocinitomix catalasitica TaxID=184607 RepID=UPI001B808AF0|nr:mannose-1-phosphate guanylyltransferase [Crocinitomix catalasitica]